MSAADTAQRHALLSRPVYQLPGLTPEQMTRVAAVLRPAAAEWAQGHWAPEGLDFSSPLRKHRGPPETLRELVEFWPSNDLCAVGLTLTDIEAIEASLATLDLRLPTAPEAVAFHYERLYGNVSAEELSPLAWVDPADVLRERSPEPLFELIVGLQGWLTAVMQEAPWGHRMTSAEIERAFPELFDAHAEGSSSEAGFYLEVGLQDARALWGLACYTPDCWTTLVLGDFSGLQAAIKPNFKFELVFESRARQQWAEGFMLRAAQHEHDPDGEPRIAEGLWLPNQTAYGSQFQAQVNVRDRRGEPRRANA